ncbi:Protein-tyrosine phosphatase [Caenorhabditis elegans]|uniref:Protein-tyrosine phosphatase n=1 Tax=Caenorhabditis elegans TaxID=6239 RepID=O45085_CAEEL|nr:Protein-tyrosine phosphatase [Caenorhabditis elegans]CCD64993.1 Protein-tyrosine phosphatase [Caenorhabditis elegans]|eukprot:NP_501041.1 Tyrosine-protein phosphatase [Caenorhabditis elegans]
MGMFKKRTVRKGKKGNTKTENERGPKKDKGGKTIVDEDIATTITAPPPNASQQPQLVQAHPIVEQFVQRALDYGVEKLRDEFRQMAKYTRPDMTQNAFNANQSANINETKNRYADVPCQDQNIVLVAKPPAPSDYVHANFVGCPMVPDKRFICTQGPLDHTVDDFWWMIVQQKVEQIVMLCKTIETGKYKCAQYWPLAMGEKKEVKGGIVVENVSGTKPMDRDAEIQITTLQVSFGDQKMSVRHLHWSDWPDRGVPPCKLTSLELLSAVRGSRVPIVVHCSAGIGRTGTIVAIEYILERIAENKQCPPMPDLVKSLRDQRAYSIQTDMQYLYIHRVMLNYFLEKYKDKYAALLNPDNVAKYTKFVKDYNFATGQ